VVVVADVNAAWRSRPFEALAERRPVLGLRPMDRLLALKTGTLPWGSTVAKTNELKTLSLVLPFGWASRGANKGVNKAMRSMWNHVRKVCAQSEENVSALVVTSPHYAPLVAQLPSDIRSFYYCSDDYLSYEGWDPDQMRRLEGDLLTRVCHSFFVSDTLRNRAVTDHSLRAEQTSVSKNATSPEFIRPVPDEAIARQFQIHSRLQRPIAGVIGVVNDRIDIELLLKVASIDGIGTLLVVGEIGRCGPGRQIENLLNHPKLVSIGRQPEDSMPLWHQLLDVALIPYAKCWFNYYCSPLRLFNHLASGRPIVATSACPQLSEFAGHVTIAADEAEFVSSVASAVAQIPDTARLEAQCRLAERETWAARAAVLDQKLG
jgi:hypothetical protein